MFLSAAANYDYKDFSKLCDLFPSSSSSVTAGASSSALNTNDKRKYERQSTELLISLSNV